MTQCHRNNCFYDTRVFISVSLFSLSVVLKMTVPPGVRKHTSFLRKTRRQGWPIPAPSCVAAYISLYRFALPEAQLAVFASFFLTPRRLVVPVRDGTSISFCLTGLC